MIGLHSTRMSRLGAWVVAMCLLVGSVRGAMVAITADTADTNTHEVRATAASFTNTTATNANKDPASGSNWIGRGNIVASSGGLPQTRTYLVPFFLPGDLAGQTLTDAGLSMRLAGIANGGVAANVNYNGDLYGLARTHATSGAGINVDHFLGANDAGATKIADNYVVNTSSTGIYAASNSTLVDFVQAKIDGGAAGQYVFFRVNPDDIGQNLNAPGTPGTNYSYIFSTANTGDAPSLSLTTDNMVLNHSFETAAGTSSGAANWTRQGSGVTGPTTDQAHWGDYSMEIDAANANDPTIIVRQDSIPVTPDMWGGTATISTWVLPDFLESGTSASMKTALFQSGSPIFTHSETIATASTPSGWTEASFDVVIPTSVDAINIQLFFGRGSNQTARVYFDDASITVLTIPEPATIVILVGGFPLALLLLRRRQRPRSL